MSPPAGAARRRIEFPVVDLRGTPRQIGHQLGEARRASVREMLAEVKSNLIEARAPQVADELRGIAEGAAITLEESYMMQIPFAGCGLLLGSRRWREPTSALDDYLAGTTGGCTTFGVTKAAARGGKVFLGQTCDFYPNYKAYWSIRRITPAQGPAILAAAPDRILTWGNGLNASSLGVEYNLLGYPDARYGLTPFALGRMMLNQTSIEDAAAIAESGERSSAWNWMLADADGSVFDLETTATRSARLLPQRGVLAHANCYLTAEFAVDDLSVQLLPDSHLRANRMHQLLERGAGDIDVGYIKECFEDHLNYPKSICRHPLEGTPMNENLDSNILIVSDLEERALYACPGPVCEHELVRYALN